MAQDFAVKPKTLDYSARKLLVDNVERLMADHPDLGKPVKLAKKARWPAGKKKGKPISERQIRYMLDLREDAIPATPSPTLDLIVGIANAFEVPAWQLLADDRVLRIWELGRLFDSREAVTDKTVEANYPLPPSGVKQQPGKRSSK